MSLVQHIIRIHSVIRYAGMFPTVANMQEALALAIRYNLKAECIGHWLYCFTTPLIGVQLEAAGFWYSVKHCAFIFSGSEKDGLADDESLDEIRARLGSEKITGDFYV